MSKTINLDQFVEAGYIDVDAGSIWIGDGCYVLNDKDEERPSDLGEEWHDICSRFFSRSGYSKREAEWRSWTHKRDIYLFESPEWQEWFENHSNDKDHQRPGTAAYERKASMIKLVNDRFEAENPFTPVSVDTGFAMFNHDAGHAGMGMMISTNYGDGSYPVYIKYGANGRPSQVLIDFGDIDAEDADEDDIQEAAE